MLKKIVLALLPGLLLFLGWTGIGITPLLFVAFVPLLLLEKELKPTNTLSWIGYSFLSMLFWWLLGTWWLALEHWVALLAASLTGSILFTLVLMFFRFIKNKLGQQRGFLALPFLWISAESLLLNGELAFPWLNLGNALANRVEIVQWYEYVGVMGGSLWIWLVNLSVYSLIRSYQKKQLTSRLGIRLIIGCAMVVIIPLWISLAAYFNFEPDGTAAKVAVVQPGTEDSFQQFVELTHQESSSNADVLVGPEALLKGPLKLDSLGTYAEVKKLQQLADAKPEGGIIVGAITQRYYSGPYTSTAGMDSNKHWNDLYNSALFFRSGQPVQVYHKSRLVPGYETLPFPLLSKHLLAEWLQDKGLKNHGYGTQSQAEVFDAGKVSVAPLICWEADFGEYATFFTRKGAGLFSVISNDNWAGSSMARDQHLHYARLRAIENRRAVTRSTTNGVSAIINQRGDVIQSIPNAEVAVSSASVYSNAKLTYYSRAGDVVARVSYFISGFMILFAFVRGFLARQQTKL